MILTNLAKILLKCAWAALTGKLILPAQIERILFMAELAKFNAAVAAVSASADRLLAKSSSDAAALADAQKTLAEIDDATAQQIDAVRAKIDAVVPPEPEVAQVQEPAQADAQGASDPAATELPAA